MNRIVAGPVNGQLQSLVKKLTTALTNTKFSFAIIAGDLFAEDDETVTDLLMGKILFPLSTYFTVGVRPLPPRVVDRLSKDVEVSYVFRLPEDSGE